MKYTTSGMVDGTCGHAHPNMELAFKCLQKFRNKRNFSDRTVKRLDGGREHLLNAAEVYKLMDITKGNSK